MDTGGVGAIEVTGVRTRGRDEALMYEEALHNEVDGGYYDVGTTDRV